MPTIDLRTLLETRIKEAEADIQKLRAALNAINEPPSAPASRTRRAAIHTASKPQPKAIPFRKLMKVITEQPGITTTTLAKETSGDQRAILALLKEHEDSQVRREGERRATRWFVITEENQVAARARELAARPRASQSAQASPKASNGSSPKPTTTTNHPKATKAKAPATTASR